MSEAVRKKVEIYTDGACSGNPGPGGWGALKSCGKRLLATGQPLAATDVFRAGSGWENFLTTRALRTLTAQFRDAGFTPPRADVRDAVTKPHLWLVKAEGLTLLFPPYSFGGPHALGGAEVTVPWADLARYLNPQAPQPIRAPA